MERLWAPYVAMASDAGIVVVIALPLVVDPEVQRTAFQCANTVLQAGGGVLVLPRQTTLTVARLNRIWEAGAAQFAALAERSMASSGAGPTPPDYGQRDERSLAAQAERNRHGPRESAARHRASIQ